MEEQDKDDNEEFKIRIRELIARVENGENSPEAFQQLLEKINQITRSAISITKKQDRKYTCV